jgi:hypothetical protein
VNIAAVMFTFLIFVYIRAILAWRLTMATADSVIVHKHFRLDKNKLKRAQALLKATTETEAVERALDLAIEEQERNRIVEKAHREFLESGIVIRDVFGRLAD